MKLILILAIAIFLMTLAFGTDSLKVKRAFNSVYTYDDAEELEDCLDDFPTTNTTFVTTSGFNAYMAQSMVDDSPYSNRVEFLNKVTATLMNAIEDVDNNFEPTYYLKLRKNYEQALTSCTQ